MKPIAPYIGITKDPLRGPIINPVPSIIEYTPKVVPRVSCFDISLRYARIAGGNAPAPKLTNPTKGRIGHSASMEFTFRVSTIARTPKQNNPTIMNGLRLSRWSETRPNMSNPAIRQTPTTPSVNND